MGTDSIEQIIGMAILDRSFRDRLVRDPGLAIIDIPLSAAERETLGAIRAPSFERFAARVDQLCVQRKAVARRPPHDIDLVPFRAAG